MPSFGTCFLLSVLLVGILLVQQNEARTKFVINLDHLTFDKVVVPGRGGTIVVKFDTESPHGPFQEAFVGFAEFMANSSVFDEQRMILDGDQQDGQNVIVGKRQRENGKEAEDGANKKKAAPQIRPYNSAKRILVTEVRIKDNAPESENPNTKLLERFNLLPEDLPVFGILRLNKHGKWSLDRRRVPSDQHKLELSTEGMIDALDLAHWVSMKAGVHLHYPALSHKDLAAAHELFNKAMLLILSNDFGTLEVTARSLTGAAERVRNRANTDKSSPVGSEIIYHAQLLNKLVGKLKEEIPKGNVRQFAPLVKEMLQGEERAVKELLHATRNVKKEGSNAETLRATIRNKLTILHMAIFRIEHNRGKLERYYDFGEPSAHLRDEL